MKFTALYQPFNPLMLSAHSGLPLEPSREEKYRRGPLKGTRVFAQSECLARSSEAAGEGVGGIVGASQSFQINGYSITSVLGPGGAQTLMGILSLSTEGRKAVECVSMGFVLAIAG